MISLLKKVLNRFRIYFSRVSERIYLKRQMKKNRGKCTVVFPEGGIGDVCIAMAYLESFREKAGKEIILYLCDLGSLRTISSLYLGYDEIRYVKVSRMKSISRALSYRGRWRWYEKYHAANELIIASPWAYLTYGMLYYKKLDCLSVLSDTAYRLGGKGTIALPALEPDEKPETSGKSVLFNVFSNSLTVPVEKVFPPIAEYFAAAGYEVYTNCKDEQSYCLPGTKPYVATITELYKTARRFEYIVSIRSGILDFLAATGVKQIVFYNGISYVNLYSMKMWGCVDALELMWDDENAMQKIKAYVEGGNES